MNAQLKPMLDALTAPLDWKTGAAFEKAWNDASFRIPELEADLLAAEAQLEDMRGRLVEARAELARIRSRRWWQIWN